MRFPKNERHTGFAYSHAKKNDRHGMWLALATVSLLLGTKSPAAAAGCVETKKINQLEARDSAGKITMEAAIIHVMDCDYESNVGTQIKDILYIYQYVKRPGYRVIWPPNWDKPLSGKTIAGVGVVPGHDVKTFKEAEDIAYYAVLHQEIFPWRLAGHGVWFPQTGQPSGWDWSSREAHSLKECADICPVYRAKYSCRSFFWRPATHGERAGRCDLHNYTLTDGFKVEKDTIHAHDKWDYYVPVWDGQPSNLPFDPDNPEKPFMPDTTPTVSSTIRG